MFIAVYISSFFNFLHDLFNLFYLLLHASTICTVCTIFTQLTGALLQTEFPHRINKVFLILIYKDVTAVIS